MEGDLSYPAVGMLIFASYPAVGSRAGSPSFNSPRPFLTLGSGVDSEEPSHNDLEDWPPHPSLHHVSALNAFLLKASLFFLSVRYHAEV